MQCGWVVVQVLALIQRVVTEGKWLTQRDAYYTLIQHFKHQSEFNDTLQGLFLHLALICGLRLPSPSLPPCQTSLP